MNRSVVPLPPTDAAIFYGAVVAGRRWPVRKVSGREALSTPFRFEVAFVDELGVELDPDELVRSAGAVVVERHDGRVVRRIDGVWTEVVVGIAGRGAAEVRAVLEPRLAVTRHRTDIRLFRDRTAVQIVREVLASYGIEPELRLAAEYPLRPYTVQMKESDLAFVSRLLEDEGIFYFFRDGDVVVLGDGPAAYEAVPLSRPELGLRYRTGLAPSARDETLSELTEGAGLTVDRVTLSDWSQDRPSLDLASGAKTPPPAVATGLDVEWYDYPGEFELPAEGARKVALVAEGFACRAVTVSGRAHAGALAPGGSVLLSELPGADDVEVALVSVDHAFSVDEEGFAVRFEALPKTVPFRPDPATPEPLLAGPMIGFVTGPPGEDVHTDAAGRVKVHFPWDRLTPWDDTCSDWVPVLQDNTGHSVALPRVGWEVLVHFLEGDPDRPVVLGRLYNGADPFPEALPANKTRSALQSLSSPGRDGANLVRFEDMAGQEQLMVHAERDQTIVVANDKRRDVVADERSKVARDEVVNIGATHTSVVGRDDTTAIDGEQRWTVSGDRTETVGAATAASAGKNHALSIGAAHFRRVGTDDVVQVNDLRETVGAAIVETSIESNTTSSGKAMALVVGGAHVEIARKGKSETAQVARIETIGAAVISRSVGATSLTAQTRLTTVGGALFVSATKELALTSALAVNAAATVASVTAPAGITLKVGSSVVTLKDGVLSLEADSVVAVRSGGPAKLGSDESTQA